MWGTGYWGITLGTGSVEGGTQDQVPEELRVRSKIYSPGCKPRSEVRIIREPVPSSREDPKSRSGKAELGALENQGVVKMRLVGAD